MEFRVIIIVEGQAGLADVDWGNTKPSWCGTPVNPCPAQLNIPQFQREIAITEVPALSCQCTVLSEAAMQPPRIVLLQKS